MGNRIQITVENTSTTARNNEPVTLGMPIPLKENVKEVMALKLYDGEGQVVPCQFTPLAWWPKQDCISWVLAHFQASVAEQNTRYYYLQLNATEARNLQEKREIVCLKGNVLKVDTGKLKFTIETENISVVLSKLLGLPEDQYVGPYLLTNEEVRLTPGQPHQICIDENGSEKAVLKLAGPYLKEDETTSIFDYVIRIELYYGKSYFRLFNTIISRDKSGALADASFVIPTNGLSGNIYSEQGLSLLESNSAQDSELLALIHDSHKEYSLLEDEDVKQVENKFQGWITSEKVSASIRFFWQMYPKSLEINQKEIRLGLLPSLSRNKDSFKLTDQMVDCYLLTEGEARTHELMFCIHDQQPEPRELTEVFASLNSPLMPTAPWEWYVDSQFFGDLTVKDDQRFPEFENLVNDSLQMILKRREELGLYGDRNFGDDLMNKSGMWNNSEYDYPHAGILQFIRGSGQEWYTDFALPAARHMYNIDFVNAGEHAGKIHPHSIWHNTATPKLGSHSWLQGVLEYYLMSGDYRARDLAELVGEYWCSSILAATSIGGTERAITWPLISMLALYKVFGNPKYMAAAEKIRDRVVELFNPDLGHFEGCMKRENYAPSYWQVFLMGSPVLESLIMYYQLTEDTVIKDMIVTIAKRLAKVNWIEELGQWEYTRTKGVRGHHTPKNNRMVSPGVAYAYLYSGDQELWEKAITAFENSYGEVDDQGKEMTQSLRFGVRMPALIAKVQEEQYNR